MKKSVSSISSSKLYCSIFGHNYQLSKQVTNFVKEYECSCCKQQVTVDSNGKLTPLTPKYKDINRVLEKIYANKLSKMRRIRKISVA